MTIDAAWIINGLAGLLIMVIGAMVGLAFSKIQKNTDNISKINKELGDFVSIDSCDRRKEAVDVKISNIYHHQERHYELLRQDIKDVGKEIKDDISKHMDDHLKAYHK